MDDLERTLSEAMDVVGRWIQCGRKVKYGRLSTANRAVRAMNKKGSRKGLSSYKCPYCAAFHIGHQTKR